MQRRRKRQASAASAEARGGYGIETERVLGKLTMLNRRTMLIAATALAALTWIGGCGGEPQTPPESASGTAPAESDKVEPPGAGTTSEPGGAPEGDAKANAHDAPLDYMSMVFVFMLATFIGIGVIRRVSRLLHTPLMSLTNAISAIAVVGSIIIAGQQATGFSTVLGTIALAASMTNIVSGFLLTDRMLKMFKKREGGNS